ncbi:MAG TPA: ABC transporter permease [Acidimicrobiia bacterium]|nr:ABC transporter permease [Acidimicrobiia bacterium]
MRAFFDRTWGVMRKELRQWRRDRQAAAAPMVLPIVLMILSAVLFGQGGDAWPTGFANESSGPTAAEFSRSFEDAQSRVSPYFHIVTRDPVEAEELVDQGRLHMAVTIPEDFSLQAASGEPAVVLLETFNINTDVTKNVRLRVDRVVQEYLADQGATSVVVEEVPTRAEDVSRGAFIAGGGVVLAILLGGLVNTALMSAREWERRTVKEIRLATRPAASVTAGKVGAGLMATAANVAVTLAVAAAVFGLRPPSDRIGTLVGVGSLAVVASAGLGLAVGTWLKEYRTVQPILGVVVAGSFFASGGFASIATMPHSVRAFNRFWPPSYIFEEMQWLMHAPSASVPGTLWVGLGAAAVIGVGLGVFAQQQANQPSSGRSL